MSEAKEEPRYLGPCLISPLELGEVQPHLEEWTPPQDWRDEGWEPRITYRGLSTEQTETFTNAFQMFEEEVSEKEDKNLMLLSSLPLYFRTMKMTNSKRNAQFTIACQNKSVDNLSSGPSIHLDEFLKIVDEEQRKDAVDNARGYADRLTSELKMDEKQVADEQKEKQDADLREKNKRRAMNAILEKRRNHYLRQGGQAKVKALRGAVAKNEPMKLSQILDPNNPNAPATLIEPNDVNVDPVLSQSMAQSGDTEGLVTLHQLAVERHPRPRGRPPSDPMGDTASYLESFPLADQLPDREPPWQRLDPEPVTLAMVRDMRKEREDGFAPWLPPPVFWENRRWAIKEGNEASVQTKNETSDVPMWPVESSSEEQMNDAIRSARREGRRLLTTASAVIEEAPPEEEVKKPEPPVRLTLEERALARAAAAEERARVRADQQLAELRKGQDAKAWELMRRRSRLKTLQEATLRGKLEHKLKQLGLTMPKKTVDRKSFREVVVVAMDHDKLKSKDVVKRDPPKHHRPPSWQLKRSLKDLGPVSSLAIGPEIQNQDRFLAVGRSDEHISIWNTTSFQRVASYCQQHGPFRYPVPFVVWLPSVEQSESAQVHPSFISGSGDGRIRVFSSFKPKPNAKGGEPSAASGNCGGGWGVVQTVRGHRTAIRCAHTSFDNRWIVTGCAGGVTAGDRLSGTIPVVRVWALDSISVTLDDEPIRTPSLRVADDGGVDFSFGGTTEAKKEPVTHATSGLLDCSAAAEGQGHSISVTSVSWIPGVVTVQELSPQESGEVSEELLYHLVSGSRDGELRQWCCRLQRPNSDHHSQHLFGSSDPVPPSSMPLQVVRVFRTGEMQVSACSFLGFGTSSNSSGNECQIEWNMNSETIKNKDDKSIGQPINDEVQKNGSQSEARVIVGDATGKVNVWSLCLPCRTPLEEEELVREANMAPSPREGLKPAGRRIAPKPPAPTATLMGTFDHCTVRKCIPIDIPQEKESSSPSVLLALSNPFSSSGFHSR